MAFHQGLAGTLAVFWGDLEGALSILREGDCVGTPVGVYILRTAGRVEEAAASLPDMEKGFNATRFAGQTGPLFLELGRFRDALDPLTRTRGNCTVRCPACTLPVEECQRLVELEDRLPAIFEGNLEAADPGECFVLAKLCLFRGRPEAAVGHFRAGFRVGPPNVEDPAARWRIEIDRLSRAAEAAAMAGSVEDALTWLGLALERWGELLGALVVPCNLDCGDPFGTVIWEMLRFKNHPHFASIRDEAEVAKLPPDLGRRCRELRERVDGVWRRWRQ
jgi:hypothetical protein